MCGEKYYVTVGKADHEGSPPRMRGKVYSRTCSIVLDGITPAYAGKSFLMFLRSGLLRDHPRVCGEKGSRIFQDPAGMGSPPRMRGKERQAWPASAAMGITPAYAGKRVVDVPFSTFCWDHPRVCGEKDSSFVKYAVCIGSPPRMRGKAKWELSARERARITPAYAGKSYPQDPHST